MSVAGSLSVSVTSHATCTPASVAFTSYETLDVIARPPSSAARAWRPGATRTSKASNIAAGAAVRRKRMLVLGLGFELGLELRADKVRVEQRLDRVQRHVQAVLLVPGPDRQRHQPP